MSVNLTAAGPRLNAEAFASPIPPPAPGDPQFPPPPDPTVIGSSLGAKLSLSSIASAVDAVALNPQPLPPRDTVVGKSMSLAGRFSAVALNPQPLPPKELTLGKSFSLAGRFAAVALNPQPLPPKEMALAKEVSSAVQSRLDAVALNPQPLPPRAGGARFDEYCGTGLKDILRFPPPPPPGPWEQIVQAAIR
jgi:hypothetical protein